MVCLCDVCGSTCERITDWRLMNQSFRATFLRKKCKRKIRFTIRFKEYYDRIDIKSSSVPFIEKKEIKNVVAVEAGTSQQNKSEEQK
jgi:hypothetical protein